MSPIRVMLYAALLAVFCSAPGVSAQTEVAPDQSQSAGVVAGSTGEITLRVQQFGFGGRARPGSWAPVLVSFINQTERQREILLRIESTDPDGDRVYWQRTVAANTGVQQRAWLYTRVPFSMRGGAALTISAYDAVEASEGYRAGRRLSSLLYPITPANLAPEETELIAVVGRRTAGLSQTAERLGEDFNPLRHAPTEVVAQLEPGDIPDRWWGLDAFDTIVWTGAQPQDLRSESASAIREWVRRGGHLIVVVPPIGEQWTTELNNGLFELLPDVELSRRPEYGLANIRPLLTRRPNADVPERGVVHLLAPRGRASPGEAVRIIDDPAGRCLVARRHVGVGACTLIGIDLSAGPLRAEGLPDADAFWNRVLGRRGAAATAQEMQATATTQSYSFNRPGKVALDGDFSSVVAQEGRAAVGVLMGFVLFIVYWLVAGPIGFAVLRKARADRHAWLAFLLTSVAFTVIAWTGATAIRPSKVGGSHLTVLTHVYGQPFQSARSWTGLLLPEYGSADVTLDSGAAGSGSRSNLLSPWDGPQGGGQVRFPDARSYTIEARSPNRMDVPTRQTVKRFRADWSGLTEWGGMPRPPVTTDGTDLALSIQRVGGVFSASGELTHTLPASIENAMVIVCPGQTRLRNPVLGLTAAAGMISPATAFSLAGDLRSWEPGETLDLALATGREARRDAAQFTLSAFLDARTPTGGDSFAQVIDRTPDSRSFTDRMRLMLFYQHIAPPQFRRSQMPRQLVSTRGPMNGVDLSRWLTEPCIIIVGEVNQQQPGRPPLPIEVDGDRVELSGRTVVAWVYPLPETPPEWPAEGDDTDETSAEQPETGPAQDGGA